MDVADKLARIISVPDNMLGSEIGRLSEDEAKRALRTVMLYLNGRKRFEGKKRVKVSRPVRGRPDMKR